MTTAHYELRDGIAVIMLDNPPVNGLGYELRTAVLACLERAEIDPHVAAMVLIGANDVFCGGADIRQFNSPKYWTYPRTIDLGERIDQLAKPTIAAVAGFAMGGGMELALACRYRVATAQAKLALPEVKLGLFPGGGGTFRLPRLVGVEKAVDMMLSGEIVSGRDAAGLGLVDRVIDTALLDGAVQFAREVVNERGEGRMRAKATGIADGDALRAYFARRQAELAADPDLGPAPQTILSCIELSLTKPYDEARKAVDAATAQLMDGKESKALRHIFFAERQAARLDDVPAGTQARVIRAATMCGTGPAAMAVTGWLEKAGIAVSRIGTSTPGAPESDVIFAVLGDDTAGWISLVSEAARAAPDGAIVVAVTPFLDQDQFARLRHDSLAHFALHVPAWDAKCNVVELVRFDRADGVAAMTMMKLLKRMGRMVVVSRGATGLIGPRLMKGLTDAMAALVDHGMEPARIRAALAAWGFRGATTLPFSATTRSNEAESLSADQIAEQCIASVARVGLDLLGKGAVARKSDIDLLLVKGYGFSPLRGGPMFHVDAQA